jgi:amidase
MTLFAEYERYDATGLAELVRAGEVSAGELMEEAIARAEALNPKLNAIVTPMYEEARRIAAGRLPDGAFTGVPLLLKDLLHAYAGVPLTSGSAALRDYVPDRDSEVVARLKRAGLVVFGKTNVPEFGLVATTEPRAYGPTRNPWDLARSAGGSSGGSGAAVAAGITPIASATDGGGSIRIPAAWCGLFGLKPSRGRVPAGPFYGEVWEGAVAHGVLTRRVRDSAAALDALAGPAPGDPYLFSKPGRPFREAVDAPVGALRIAYATRSPLATAVHPECRRAVEESLALLEELGHHLTEAEAPVEGMEVARAYLILCVGEVAADLRLVSRLTGRKWSSLDLEDVTRFGGVIGESLSSAEYVESRRRWDVFGRAMGAFHEQFDLYLTPTTAAPPLEIGSLDPSVPETVALRLLNTLRTGRAARATGVPERLGLNNLAPVPFTQLANLTGQPAMSVPLHESADGQPYGIQFMAPVGREDLLFRLASQLEKARPWDTRRPSP